MEEYMPPDRFHLDVSVQDSTRSNSVLAKATLMGLENAEQDTTVEPEHQEDQDSIDIENPIDAADKAIHHSSSTPLTLATFPPTRTSYETYVRLPN
jgi:hypothetical protein